MRILIVTQNYYPDQFIINDISLILNKYFDVTVLTGFPDYKNGYVTDEFKLNKEKYSTYNGVRIIRVPIIERRKGKIRRIFNYASFMLTSSIWSIFNRNKYDLIFNFQTSPITMSFCSLLHNKTKKYMYCLDLWPESVKAMNFSEKSLVYKIALLISNFIYKKMDMISVSTKYFSHYLTSVNNVKQCKINFLPQFEKNNFLKSNKSFMKNVLNIGFMGNAGLVQNLEYLVEISKDLKINHKIHILGDGSNLERIKKLVEINNLNDNFIFYGYKKKEEIGEIVSVFDLCYLSLKVENLIGKTIPYKFQGYLSFGKPILAIIDNEIYDIIINNELGLAYNNFDKSKIINDLTLLSKNQNILNIYQNNCKKYFLENYTEEIFEKNIIENINKLMES